VRNLKLTLEYDGTNFCGWQYQPDQRSVQGELESALARLTCETIPVTAAGRTDSGVHALGQVVNFHTTSTLPLATFVRGTNALLPCDVRVRRSEEVADSFNARYDATSRLYRYRIVLRPCAVGRQYVWYLPLQLDLRAMQEAVTSLVGQHDFVSFCQSGADLQHHRCHVHEAEWRQVDDEIFFQIRANRFVHNMVRIIVGTCVEVGRGALAPGAMAGILAARDRRAAGRTAPAQGLFLVQIFYDQGSTVLKEE
jgi:tRNA pseudouridine38-40 synthase